MSKYRGLRMPRRFGLGHVSVVDPGLMYASVRRAKIGFWVTFVAVGAVTKVTARTVTSDARSWFLGVLTGFLAGAAVAALALFWPALRLGWHWAPELAAFGVLLWAYDTLTHTLPAVAAAALLLGGTGGPLLVPCVRHRVLPLLWCVVARHRLRVCFAQFLRAGDTDGRLPFILLARPTPAGERVWVWLRPGLAFTDLEGHYDRVAVATWATDVRAVCHVRWAALLRIDITRRNTLAAVVDSPLPGQAARTGTGTHYRPPVDTTPDTDTPPALVFPGLDLRGVPDPRRRPLPSNRPGGTRTGSPRPAPAASGLPQPGPDDHADWI